MNIDNYNMISSNEVFSQLYDEAKVDIMSSDRELTEIANKELLRIETILTIDYFQILTLWDFSQNCPED